jgi:SAM-dependent methyltransferase
MVQRSIQVICILLLHFTNSFVVPWWHQTRRRPLRSVAPPLSQSTLLSQQTFQDCWNANTWSVNPLNDTRIDVMLQRLCSPAPQSLFVLTRAIQQAQQQQDSNTALEQTLSQCTFLLKPGYEFQVHKDKEEWRIESTVIDNTVDTDWRSIQPSTTNFRNAVELAHEALDLVTDASEHQYPVNQQQVENLANKARNRLALTLGTDIRGRSAADAAFSFAMAGVTDVDLYDTLALVARLELERIGQRPSFRSKYILQMVEKLAAAGIIQSENNNDNVYSVAAHCLASKGDEHSNVVEMISGCGFNLFSTRPLLWLWRFSARQPKVDSLLAEMLHEKRAIENDASTGDWVSNFDDPSLPLVIDLGCGMGVSLLGLASMDRDAQDDFACSPEGALLRELKWRECNYVGGDLSQLSLGYARGIAQRWGLDKRLQFVHGSALDVVKSVESHYPKRVALIMIQFPTPFQTKDTGNSQLPCDPTSGFMVSKQLLKRTLRVLEPLQGILLLQSNCEDVAVTMRNMAEEAGFDSICVPSHVTSLADSDYALRMPQRTLEWIDWGGERAVGDAWSLTPLIPSRGATETEVSCQLSKTPVHRCLLQPRMSSPCD